MSQDKQRSTTICRAVLSGAVPVAAGVIAAGTAANALAAGIANATEVDTAVAAVEAWYAADDNYGEVLRTDPDVGEGREGTKAFNRHDKAMGALFRVARPPSTAPWLVGGDCRVRSRRGRGRAARDVAARVMGGRER
jgi:hypothetical protein